MRCAPSWTLCRSGRSGTACSRPGSPGWGCPSSSRRSGDAARCPRTARDAPARRAGAGGRAAGRCRCADPGRGTPLARRRRRARRRPAPHGHGERDLRRGAGRHVVLQVGPQAPPLRMGRTARRRLLWSGRARDSGDHRSRAAQEAGVALGPPRAAGALRRPARSRRAVRRGHARAAAGSSRRLARVRHAAAAGNSAPEALEAASKEWDSRYGDSTDRHLAYVHGAGASFCGLTAAGAPGEETTRFGALARRLWGPLLAVEVLGAP